MTRTQGNVEALATIYLICNAQWIIPQLDSSSDASAIGSARV